MECRCRQTDCEYLALDYPFCTGCGEHHRDPVATDAEPWCPVDFMSECYDEADRRGEYSISDDVRAHVRAKFAAA